MQSAIQGLRGLAIHSRSAHPESYHSKGTTEIAETIRDQTRARWDSEESALMAHEEVRLLRAGCMDLNKALSKFMAGRSFHSVKSHRRQQSYRDLVRAYVPTTGGLGAQEVAIPTAGSSWFRGSRTQTSRRSQGRRDGSASTETGTSWCRG